MREIKFRFVKEDGTFANDIALINGKPYREVNPTDNKFVRVFDDRGYSTDYYNNWATYKIAKDIIDINMYTGLKDCNGVEIYEGDIVVKKNDDTTYRLVRYDEKSCCFEFVTKKEKNKITNRGVIDSININSCCWHEVIGNIYENPELLLEK